MSKKSTPIITHTEILNRAIMSIKREIAEWNQRCEAFPQEQRDAILAQATGDLSAKLDALKEMYRIETGADYC